MPHARSQQGLRTVNGDRKCVRDSWKTAVCACPGVECANKANKEQHQVRGLKRYPVGSPEPWVRVKMAKWGSTREEESVHTGCIVPIIATPDDIMDIGRTTLVLHVGHGDIMGGY